MLDEKGATCVTDNSVGDVEIVCSGAAGVVSESGNETG